jgi:hypothetical protein
MESLAANRGVLGDPKTEKTLIKDSSLEIIGEYLNYIQ